MIKVEYQEQFDAFVAKIGSSKDPSQIRHSTLKVIDNDFMILIDKFGFSFGFILTHAQRRLPGLKFAPVNFKTAIDITSYFFLNSETRGDLKAATNIRENLLHEKKLIDRKR